MADCTRTGLLYLTPLGSGCASSPQLSLTGSISQYTYRLYASMLDQGFLQATISPSATNNLRTIAAFAIVGALLGLALWGLLAYRHVKGTRKQRLLLIVDNEEGGNTYLPNPTLAWSIPMTLLPILLAASCIIQQRMYGSSHSLIYGSMAYNGLVLLLFSLAVWLHFAGAVHSCMRMRFGRFSRWANVGIWLVAACIFLSLGVIALVLSLRWDTAYDNGFALSDALGHAGQQGLSASAIELASLSRATDAFTRSVTEAVAALNAQAGFVLLWLVLAFVAYLPLAIMGIVRPRASPPTPGLGLDFGQPNHRLSVTLASLGPRRSSSALHALAAEPDEKESSPSFARGARLRLFCHLTLGLVWTGLIAYSVSGALAHEAMVGVPSLEVAWIWRTAIVPGWTHAIGCLIANGWLLAWHCLDAPTETEVKRSEEVTTEKPVFHLTLPSPTVKIDMMDEEEKPRSPRRKVPPRPASQFASGAVRIDVLSPEAPGRPL